MEHCLCTYWLQKTRSARHHYARKVEPTAFADKHRHRETSTVDVERIRGETCSVAESVHCSVLFKPNEKLSSTTSELTFISNPFHSRQLASVNILLFCFGRPLVRWCMLPQPAGVHLVTCRDQKHPLPPVLL